MSAQPILANQGTTLLAVDPAVPSHNPYFTQTTVLNIDGSTTVRSFFDCLAFLGDIHPTAQEYLDVLTTFIGMKTLGGFLKDRYLLDTFGFIPSDERTGYNEARKVAARDVHSAFDTVERYSVHNRPFAWVITLTNPWRDGTFNGTLLSFDDIDMSELFLLLVAGTPMSHVTGMIRHGIDASLMNDVVLGNV
jgi:hypothetical protein